MVNIQNLQKNILPIKMKKVFFNLCHYWEAEEP